MGNLPENIGNFPAGGPLGPPFADARGDKKLKTLQTRKNLIYGPGGPIKGPS